MRSVMWLLTLKKVERLRSDVVDLVLLGRVESRNKKRQANIRSNKGAFFCPAYLLFTHRFHLVPCNNKQSCEICWGFHVSRMSLHAMCYKHEMQCVWFPLFHASSQRSSSNKHRSSSFAFLRRKRLPFLLFRIWGYDYECKVLFCTYILVTKIKVKVQYPNSAA